jgi:hypothetical protein
MGKRNDAAKRERNAALRPGDLGAEQAAWMWLVQEARRTMTAKGLPTPAGLPEAGHLWLGHYMVAATGFVKWKLWYKLNSKSEGIEVGWFVTEFLPDKLRYLQAKPIQTHGKTVMVQQKVSGELARPVRVLVDAGGLPVPVDPAIWAAMGLG